MATWLIQRVIDRTFKINILDSLKFNTRYFLEDKLEDKELGKTSDSLGLDLKEEQVKNQNILEIINQLKKDNETIVKQNRYTLMDEVLYYI